MGKRRKLGPLCDGCSGRRPNPACAHCWARADTDMHIYRILSWEFDRAQAAAAGSRFLLNKSSPEKSGSQPFKQLEALCAHDEAEYATYCQAKLDKELYK